MLSIPIRERNGTPKYEQIYRHIRVAIERGRMTEGEKLPSKRGLAAHLGLGLNTVENAYAQLVAEGYIEAREKRGYYVQRVETAATPVRKIPAPAGQKRAARNPVLDLGTSGVDVRTFPFDTWARLMRQSLRGQKASLLDAIHPQGDLALRREIVAYLRAYRGMEVSAEQVFVGAGTATLIGMLADLLPDHRFAVENPCYPTIPGTLRNRRLPFEAVALDREGMRIDALRRCGADVAFLTPSHHFPLGTVMSINRRMRMLEWAHEQKDRYLIEDDYDSEFRYALRPVPTLHSLDHGDTVIFINTFARTLAPSLRIAYLVLPPALLARYRERSLFHPNTVSIFEQQTLRRFIEGGFYERHLSRMRKNYKKRRDILVEGLRPLAHRIDIAGEEAGLHLLLRARGRMTEHDMVKRAEKNGVRVYGLSRYYLVPPAETRTVAAGFGRLSTEELRRAARILCRAWE